MNEALAIAEALFLVLALMIPWADLILTIAKTYMGPRDKETL